MASEMGEEFTSTKILNMMVNGKAEEEAGMAI